MRKVVIGTLLAMLATAGMAQQRQPVFADPTGRTSPPPPAPSQKPARFAEPERLSAGQQRCRNLDTEIARNDEQARQASTTGAQNQFNLKRQQLLEQRGRAGC